MPRICRGTERVGRGPVSWQVHGVNDAFDRLIDLKRMGRSAHEAMRIALAEGHSRIHLIRAVREVFCVEVFEPKGTLVQARNGSLARLHH